MRNIRLFGSALCAAVVLVFTGPHVLAQSKPANATGQCKDGTYTTAKSKQGACSTHGGVQTWFADAKGITGATKAAAKSTEKAASSAGKATASGAEKAATATKDATKTAAKATGNAASSAANAIKPRPSDAPQDATAKCKDGSYSHAKGHRGACSGHGGVAEWYK